MRKTQPGGGKPDKIIRDALQAALRNDPNALKTIAKNWIERAKDDQVSASALADRLDGKAVQTLAGDADNPIAVKDVTATDQEIIAQYLKGQK